MAMLSMITTLSLLLIARGSQEIRQFPYGSNCVIEETGVIPPYYQCYGCRIEEAMGCLSDMRLNKSGNVKPQCAIRAISQEPDPLHCCPSLIFEGGRLNLNYLGSAYPETLRCIASVGCGSSAVYSGLLTECQGVCEGLLDQNGNTICLAQFNAAARTAAISFVVLTIVTAPTVHLFVI